MTTELEKQFFDAFDIKQKTNQVYGVQLDYHINEYPQITDRILLELILINMHNEDLFGYPTNIQELKDSTLKQLIETYNKFSTCVTCDGEYQQSARDIKQQVQALFKE